MPSSTRSLSIMMTRQTRYLEPKDKSQVGEQCLQSMSYRFKILITYSTILQVLLFQTRYEAWEAFTILHKIWQKTINHVQHLLFCPRVRDPLCSSKCLRNIPMLQNR